MSYQLIEPVQEPDNFILSDITALSLPALRLFDEMADCQMDLVFDRGEHPDHPAPSANLHVQPLFAVGRGDPIIIDFREVIEGERVGEALLPEANRLGESLPVIVNESGGLIPSALLIRFEPDVHPMGCEAAFSRYGTLARLRHNNDDRA